MMPLDHFRAQISRIVATFGKASFSEERISLIYSCVQGLSADEFTRVTNLVISEHRYAPLPKDFSEAAAKVRKNRVDHGILGISKKLDQIFESGLPDVLKNRFPGCKTVNEAIEVRRLEIQVQKAKDPDYDPMTDKEWMG